MRRKPAAKAKVALVPGHTPKVEKEDMPSRRRRPLTASEAEAVLGAFRNTRPRHSAIRDLLSTRR